VTIKDLLSLLPYSNIKEI